MEAPLESASPVIFVEQNNLLPGTLSRKDLASVKRIVIKVGTNVVTQDGTAALGRIANLVEQVVQLQKKGKEVIVVSSGAVGLGRPVLQSIPESGKEPADTRSSAAVGQPKLMHIYEFLFNQKGTMCSQILVTDADFRQPIRRKNLRLTIEHLLKLKIVPILNENDVVAELSSPLLGLNNTTASAPTQDFLVLWDNDSLACLTGLTTSANLVILLSDVDGVYKKLPGQGEQPDIIATWYRDTQVSFGAKSSGGRGGMQAKIDAILRALHEKPSVEDAHKGIDAVVIANGMRADTVLKIMSGEEVGTLFVRWQVNEELVNNSLSKTNLTSVGASAAGNTQSVGTSFHRNNTSGGSDSKRIAIEARNGSRALQKLGFNERKAILLEIADSLLKNESQILQANEKDIKIASSTNTSSQLVSRLKLNNQKIKTLIEGIRAIASSKDDPVGKLLRKTQLADGLLLEQVTAPIGVLLVIFESRPEVLPQVSALALMSGNGLLLKGGKEAVHSNAILHSIISDAVQRATKGRVPRGVIGLVETRETIADLLKHHEEIDLVIPRGSAQLVSSIQKGTKIPVMGHSEGICHVYLHSDATEGLYLPIIIDAKTDYPSACNAAETLLINRSLFDGKRAPSLLEALKKAGVSLYSGPKLHELMPNIPATKSFKEEYGDLGMTIEVVEDLDEAISHINRFGSSHTDAIVTRDGEAAKRFLNEVDSACVFHNASTRFADGYRFGLGAEVGISTGRIHARGPVGIDGLLTSKWRLFSEKGHIASDFSKGKEVFTHLSLPLSKL